MSETKLPYANKDLGQHFLRDQKIIQKISHDFHEKAESIIEVGPGPAILSQHLSKHQLPYTLLEKDLRFEENLTAWVKREQIIFGDALQVDLASLVEKQNLTNENIWFVSNLPYNISVPLFLKFLRFSPVRYMTLMFQKEVAEKIVPAANTKNPMSSLMAIGQNYFVCRTLCKAPPGAFMPPPQVDSLVLSLERRESPVISLDEFEKFESFLRTLFQFKRKQVTKVLKTRYPVEKILSSLEACQLSSTARAETFNLDQIQLLYRELNP